MLERTSHVLAVLSSGVGVAMSTASSHDTLEHVHFSRLAEQRVLAVVVTRSGMVRDRVLSLDRDLTMLELETASRFLNEHFRGWSMERIRTELAHRIENERSTYQQMMEAAQQLWNQTVGIAAGGQAVFVDGVANLLGLPEDRARLREMLTALEAKERLVELLNAYIDARQESVRVVFDLEQQAPEMAGLVLIAAPARVAGENLGSVGVIGPKRMNYPSNMSAVAYVAQMLERALDAAKLVGASVNVEGRLAMSNNRTRWPRPGVFGKDRRMTGTEEMQRVDSTGERERAGAAGGRR